MYLTTKEQLRIDIISRYLEGDIHREHAQTALELEERQFRRVVKRFKEHGFLSLKHGNCGSTPKNKVNPTLENQIIQLATNKYKDFNMTHFREKLLQEAPDVYLPSYSTIRRIFTEHKIYKPQKKRSKRPHKSRNRYEREGIMVQIDGSHHVWFGHQKTCLIGAIDDATGKILGARFSKTETTFATMDVLEQVLIQYGCFHILYSDKAGIYENKKREGFTNATRAMKQVGIASILAHSPQAKGRVERLWGTLQDRLVSEMRLRNISTIEEANVYLSDYILEYNQKFSVLPASPYPAYKPLSAEIDLNQIFCTIEQRIVDSGYGINLDNERYVIKTNLGTSIKRRPVDIRTYRDGTQRFFIQDQEVQVEKLNQDFIEQLHKF